MTKEFALSYFIKTIRYCLCYVSLRIARKTLDRDPLFSTRITNKLSQLTKFVISFLIIDIVLNTILTLILWPMNIKHFFSDYLLSIVIIAKIGITFAYVFSQKKSSSALGTCISNNIDDAITSTIELIMVVSAVILYVPFFMLH
jgi:hypothetical protein